MAKAVTDVELWSPAELLSFIYRKTGEAEDELEEETIRESARLAAVSHLRVSALKQVIAEAGLSCASCVTKGDLRKRAVEAVWRLRHARRVPTIELARALVSKRDHRRYTVKFAGKDLGFTMGLTDGRVVATQVTRTDLKVLQAGDELLFVNDYPLLPSCGDAHTFRSAVLDRVRDAPRPLDITFAVGDMRWPPELPSSHHLANRELLLAEEDEDDDEPPPEAGWADFVQEQQRIHSQRLAPPKKPPPREPDEQVYTGFLTDDQYQRPDGAEFHLFHEEDRKEEEPSFVLAKDEEPCPSPSNTNTSASSFRLKVTTTHRRSPAI